MGLNSDALDDIIQEPSVIQKEGESINIIAKTDDLKEAVTSMTDNDLNKLPGMDVSFITIGDNHREYLVHFGYLQARLAELGIDLLLPEEMAALKIKESTGMFKGVYDRVNTRFGMPPKIRDYSFLNRWFIFRRRSYGPLTTASQRLGVDEGEPIVLPKLPVSSTSTRGRGGSTRGRGRGSSVAASVPAVMGAPAPPAPLVVELTRGRGGSTRSRGRGRGGNKVTIDL